MPKDAKVEEGGDVKRATWREQNNNNPKEYSQLNTETGSERGQEKVGNKERPGLNVEDSIR